MITHKASDSRCVNFATFSAHQGTCSNASGIDNHKEDEAFYALWGFLRQHQA